MTSSPSPAAEPHPVEGGRKGQHLREHVGPGELAPDAAVALAHGDVLAVCGRVSSQQRQQRAGMSAGVDRAALPADRRDRGIAHHGRPLMPHGAFAPEIGRDDARIGERLGRRAVGDLLAVAQHHHAVAERRYHIHVVLDQQHRDTALLARVEDEARHVFLLFLVHAGHRLVEDQEARLGHQRARQLDALLQPEGNDLDRRVAHVLQLQEVDGVLDQLALLHLVALGPKPVEQRRERRRAHVDVAAQQDVVEHAHAAEEREVLEGARDTQSPRCGAA